jgi:hypothetical protein
MSEPTVEAAESVGRQAAYRAAIERLSRDGGKLSGEVPGVGQARTRAPRMSDAAVFQDLAATGEFAPAELREAVDGMDLLRMSRTDPGEFASIAKEVGAEVRDMDGPRAVREVVRAIMSGARKGGTR